MKYEETRRVRAADASSMARGKKAKRPEGKTVCLKEAQSSVEVTLDGRRRLNLSFKGISAAPKCIQKLSDVDEVDLSRNLIRKIPEFIGKFVNVAVLDLHSNYLEQVPVVIGRLQNLQVLNLCNNRLTELPGELGLLKNLHILNLGLNQLQVLPPSIGGLKELRRIGLSDNHFSRIPACLSKLEKLEKVNLERNPVVTEQRFDQQSLMVTEKLYLVKESLLCERCFNKCQTESSESIHTEDHEDTRT